MPESYEVEGTARLSHDDGVVRVQLPGEGNYLRFTPEQAQDFGRRLIVEGIRAQGGEVKHLAVIPLGG